MMKTITRKFTKLTLKYQREVFRNPPPPQPPLPPLPPEIRVLMNEKDFACQDYVDKSSPSTFKNDSTCLLMA